MARSTRISRRPPSTPSRSRSWCRAAVPADPCAAASRSPCRFSRLIEELQMNPRRDFANRPSGQQGFTLVELLVALAVTVVVVLGILLLFDFNNKLTRV